MSNVLGLNKVLHNGVEMPVMGYGVWLTEEGDQVINAVTDALDVGYRAIDTAQIYFNEAGVGEAIRRSGIDREKIFVTSKVRNENQGYDNTLKAYEESLEKMGLEYLDLYLIHWPMRSTYVESWRALVRLYEEKRVRAIGVSNFHVQHLEKIIDDSGFIPMVNQFEMHPRLVQPALHQYCTKNGIAVTAYCPLMHGDLDIPLIEKIAQKYGKSPAQVILRWHLHHDNIIIPKTLRKERMISNADIGDFELSSDEISQIDALNENKRYSGDPDNFPWDA